MTGARRRNDDRQAIGGVAYVVVILGSVLLALAATSPRPVDAAWLAPTPHDQAGGTRGAVVVADENPASADRSRLHAESPYGATRSVVRVGALLFALGSVAAYVAARTRRGRVREVGPDGRDL